VEYSFIERLRGIDKWPVVSATVTSVEQLSEGGRGGAWRRVTFTYRAGSEDFGGSLKVDSYSSVYELAAGDAFDIQYAPSKPSRYFCEEARSPFSTIFRIMFAVVLLFVLLVIAANLFHW
jgi:hypothetical protein